MMSRRWPVWQDNQMNSIVRDGLVFKEHGDGFRLYQADGEMGGMSKTTSQRSVRPNRHDAVSQKYDAKM